MNCILENEFKLISKCIADKTKLYQAKFLITGATGMIGSYFLCFLSWLNENELDNTMELTLLSRDRITEDHAILGHLANKGYIRTIITSLNNDFFLDSDDYDYVLHAASNAAPQTYLNEPIDTINTNVRATQILLDSFKRSHSIKAFVYYSSGEIYGSPDMKDIPTKENYSGKTDHLSLRSCYVESKRFAETLCWNYYNAYKIPTIIIRPVHVYGPGFKKNDSRVWADFIIKAVNGEDIQILSDGSARRGFCYIADAVSQIISVLQSGKPGEVYNIGNDKHVSIKELADIVAENSSNKIHVVIKNEVPDYLIHSPQISCPDVNKVKSLSPYIISTDLSKGIKKTMEFYSRSINRESII